MEVHQSAGIVFILRPVYRRLSETQLSSLS